MFVLVEEMPQHPPPHESAGDLCTDAGQHLRLRAVHSIRPAARAEQCGDADSRFQQSANGHFKDTPGAQGRKNGNYNYIMRNAVATVAGSHLLVAMAHDLVAQAGGVDLRGSGAALQQSSDQQCPGSQHFCTVQLPKISRKHGFSKFLSSRKQQTRDNQLPL